MGRTQLHGRTFPTDLMNARAALTSDMALGVKKWGARGGWWEVLGSASVDSNTAREPAGALRRAWCTHWSTSRSRLLSPSPVPSNRPLSSPWLLTMVSDTSPLAIRGSFFAGKMRRALSWGRPKNSNFTRLVLFWRHPTPPSVPSPCAGCQPVELPPEPAIRWSVGADCVGESSTWRERENDSQTPSTTTTLFLSLLQPGKRE